MQQRLQLTRKAAALADYACLIRTSVVVGMKSYTILTREQVLFIDMNDKFRYGYQNFIAFNSELTANNLQQNWKLLSDSFGQLLEQTELMYECTRALQFWGEKLQLYHPFSKKTYVMYCTSPEEIFSWVCFLFFRISSAQQLVLFRYSDIQNKISIRYLDTEYWPQTQYSAKLDEPVSFP